MKVTSQTLIQMERNVHFCLQHNFLLRLKNNDWFISILFIFAFLFWQVWVYMGLFYSFKGKCPGERLRRRKKFKWIPKLAGHENTDYLNLWINQPPLIFFFRFSLVHLIKSSLCFLFIYRKEIGVHITCTILRDSLMSGYPKNVHTH